MLTTCALACTVLRIPGTFLSCVVCRGMLIKGGKVLDALAACETIAFDKTGTLTTGVLACTGLTAPNGSNVGDGAAASAADSDLSGPRLLHGCNAPGSACWFQASRRQPHQVADVSFSHCVYGDSQRLTQAGAADAASTNPADYISSAKIARVDSAM